MDDGVVAGLVAGGAPPEVIEAARKRQGKNEVACEVWEENWVSLALFDALTTQWRIAAGMGGAVRTGLDYAPIEGVMRMMGIPRADRSGLFQDVRIMERAALEVMNKN